MNVRTFGIALLYLAVILGIVAGFYAYEPYALRWEKFEAIKEATQNGGYSASLGAINEKIASLEQHAFGFGVAAAVTAFLGIALIISAKAPTKSPEDSQTTEG